MKTGHEEEWEKWNNVRFCDDDDEDEGVVVAAIIVGAAFVGILMILVYGLVCLE